MWFAMPWGMVWACVHATGFHPFILPRSPESFFVAFIAAVIASSP